MGSYTLASKALHHLALDNLIVKKVGFDIDCMLSRLWQVPVKTHKPVFIAGLARAGTTLLLEALYATGLFTTLTYRDMPFVTSPLIWGMLTSINRRKSDKQERAHGDGVFINFDSPEAFEEVFWMTFAEDDFVKGHCLDLQMVNERVVNNYRRFVDNIVGRGKGNASVRYLAKNNNNVLRISSLKKAFPESVVLVPFRNPLDHAKSIWSQHQKFRNFHQEDPFSLQYMNWLGHFEFGENFKPFHVSDEALPYYEDEPNSLDYWVRYWTCLYGYLIQNHAGDVVFFDYDRFCEEPDNTFEKLGEILLMDSALLKQFSAKVKKGTANIALLENQGLLPEGKRVYEGLRDLCLQA